MDESFLLNFLSYGLLKKNLVGVFCLFVHAYSGIWLYFNVTNANSPTHCIRVQANQRVTITSYSSVISH